MKIALIRVDGSNSIGMGHLKRELDIAKELKKHKYKIIFLTKKNKESLEFLKRRKIKLVNLSSGKAQNLINEINELTTVLEDFEQEIEIIIVDILKFYENYDYLENLKKYCKKLVVVGDHKELLEINADIVFALSPNQDPEYYNKAMKARYYVNSMYVPLSPNFQHVEKKRIRKIVKNVLVTFGGSDPQNYTIRTIKLLKNFDFKVTVIVGPGYLEKNYNDLLQNTTKMIRLKKNVNNMKKYFERADLCICSAGTTLVELLTCGVPCIVLPQTERELNHALAFESKNLIRNLGLNFGDAELIKQLNKFISDYSLRKRFSVKAQSNFDGQGLKRVVEKILDD